ncbi:Asp/Glu/Hydantoin racemase family protein [Candidatus Protochlamydia naegleriophila]|uniref:Asp/Glu/Hydantoin racemase family protein n=1 Tax=Candidatus Protochlamydia naegleriophila TaxID=389348 RepID=A0A0U5JHZ4_9BACT|nr:aspartate/glutamate racemase family protein [Candidatus Protochlamydia naegleriophila]CUI17414.1 Asp/Glu/Hydantoin racemase family protein [Candidatus Protochlamydia naegleriophila]
MKPKSIGIIGGAGPLAGAFLLERVLTLAGKKYGCYRDADFPKVFLISFPFSEMLTPTFDAAKVRRELRDCLDQLLQNGASILAIACNTLHAFLDDEDELDLIHLPRVLATEVTDVEPLVLCTSTSAQFGLHRRFFACRYPDSTTQKKVDQMIDQILKGEERQKIVEELKELLQSQDAKAIILGCTELSLFTAQLSLPNKLIIDPLEVVANKILEKSFSL